MWDQSSSGSRISHKGVANLIGGADSRGCYVSKILHAKRKDSGSLGGGEGGRQRYPWIHQGTRQGPLVSDFWMTLPMADCLVIHCALVQKMHGQLAHCFALHFNHQIWKSLQEILPFWHCQP